MAIRADETVIVGGVSVTDGRVEDDEISRRIVELIETELQKLGHDASGWDALYIDPSDGRFWELIYPRSHMHGGGPPTLRCITYEEAEQKYGEALEQASKR